MRERIIIVGAGGQGVMLLGKIIALAGLREGKEVSWIPAYGAEVRGGTAYCMVIISDEEIASPIIEKADTLIIMNEPSLRKFKEKIDAQGLIIINASLIKAALSSIAKNNSKIKKVRGPFTDIAFGLGNIKVANMVALGVYIAKKKIISLNTVLKVIEEIAPADKRGLIEINRKALSCGLKIK